MSAADFAYAAGLLDGEGYFSPVDSGRIRCDMTHDGAIRWMQERFGGTFNGPYVYASDRKPVWKWTLSRLDDKERLLHGVIPFMRVRRASAEAMLELVEHSLYNRPAKNWHGRGPKPPEWVAWVKRRAALQQALKESRA